MEGETLKWQQSMYYPLTPIFQGFFFFHLKPKQQKFFIEILGYFFTVYPANTIYYFRKHSKKQIRRDASIALFGYWTWDHMWHSQKEREKYSTSENNESLLCTLDLLGGKQGGESYE